MALPEADIAGLKELFALVDTNKDGHLSIGEFRDFCRGMSSGVLSVAQMKILMAILDSNRDGVIDEAEFIEFFSNAKYTSADFAPGLFKLFDEDGNGKLNKEEVSKAMAKLGHPFTEEELTDFFTKADVDHDGLVDLEEFTKFVS
eukprot:TRINITY_DN828_c0_g1_i3.p1 TRINITY_DN828_c0_g1~~TRINITY_DN828_c0_g1_i3.p1  ORF type:complete len:145 (+),score=36.25 TRINITY_DN828_c0_g1_i3:47-481(+)